MALVSPGVEVTVIDESNYLPAATNSVPYILVATAENKASGTGPGVAAGTLAENAGRVFLVTSQRDLATAFGNPFFYQTATGSPINGFELNEYGLLAAHSVLGVTNRAFVQRADIDLDELTATLVRPTGDPLNGTYWLDTSLTQWGIFQWNQTTGQFTVQTPIVITNPVDLDAGVPADTVGSVGNYAVVATNSSNPVYYKNSENNWVLVGSDDWKTSWPTVQGTNTVPGATLTQGNTIEINGISVNVPPGETLQSLVDAINGVGIAGVSAEVDASNRFVLYGDSATASDGSTADGGIISIGAGSTAGLLTALGIAADVFLTPALQQSPNFTVPRWRSTDSGTRPTGSVWNKTTAANQGTAIVVKQYSTALGSFVNRSAQVFENDQSAIAALDPVGGGRNILADTLYVQFDVAPESTGLTGSSVYSQTFAVKSVPNPDGAGAIYEIDGVNRPVLELERGGVYTFDQSDASNINHPLRIRDAAGNSFTDGVVATGTPGQAGARTVFTVPLDAPDNLRYYCTVHGNGMGNVIEVTGSGNNSVDGYNNTFTLKILERSAAGATVITGSAAGPSFVNGNTFTVQTSVANSSTLTTAVTVTINGTTAADFITAVSAAAVPGVSAALAPTGEIVFTQSLGGVIVLENVIGTPLAAAGFTTAVAGVRDGVDGALILSNWDTFLYTASSTAPDQDPAAGRFWNFSAVNQIDIMIHNGTTWRGYQNVTNDVRGFNLSQTNPTGPIVGASEPSTQTDGTPLVFGDLWIETSNLDVYPEIYRWENIDGVDQWVLLDNTDQTTQNGIVFADARWSPTGTVDAVTDSIPSISSLLTSNYLDLDVPDPAIFPAGTLLWNTRRSGFNVKAYRPGYFNAADFDVESYSNVANYVPGSKVLFSGVIYVAVQAGSGNLPTDTNFWSALKTSTWVTASGNRSDGSPFLGRLAVRNMVVSAMKAAVDTQQALREEQNVFNLIAAPGYPELIPNMIALNNERSNTAFIVGDTPLRLEPGNNDLTDWATNAGGAGLLTGDGLATRDNFLGVFYPAGQTNDLSGNPVVQPASHMMLRTIVRSDEVSFPWLAPAGTRRGLVDNVARIGYVEAGTGDFVSFANGQGVRDVLYQNSINPITFLPGSGIVNYGNKTVAPSPSALDRINVARLVAFVRSRLNEIAKTFVFEPNDQITRNELSNAISGLMLDLVAKRGIFDFLVVCDESNNTPSRVDRNELYVDVAIEPVKAVEFIFIPVRIQNTGQISGGNA